MDQCNKTPQKNAEHAGQQREAQADVSAEVQAPKSGEALAEVSRPGMPLQLEPIGDAGGTYTWAGEQSWGFCLYLHVISFDFDSGVGIPVMLTFWPGGKHPSDPPTPMRGGTLAKSGSICTTRISSR